VRSKLGIRQLLQHPEGGFDRSFEPTVGEHLRLAEFNNALDRAGERELREIAKVMAKQVLVMYPAAMRFLASEAAKNLGGYYWGEEHSARMMEALSLKACGGGKA